MHTITATELARNLRQVLDRMAAGGEGVVVERNHQPIARLSPVPPRYSALEALGDLYRTLPEAAGRDWLHDAREPPSGASLSDEVRDPWAS